MVKWNDIQANYNAMQSFLNGSSQMVNSIPQSQPMVQSALSRRGIYSPEMQQREWQDNGELNEAIAQRSALNRQRMQEYQYMPEQAQMASQREFEPVKNNTSAVPTNTGSSGKFKGKFSSNQQAFYDSLVKGGLSHNQALATMMNVQAENDFMNKYLFGSHRDGQKRAYGALSWQGGREIPLINSLKKEGLISNGAIVNSPRVMELQAQHFLNELRGAEKNNATWFMQNGNADPFVLARALNKKVIRSNQSASTLAGREKAYKRFWG